MRSPPSAASVRRYRKSVSWKVAVMRRHSELETPAASAAFSVKSLSVTFSFTASDLGMVLSA